MHEFWSGFERVYNDGRKYCLHYVTAREAYNIAKAAEAGMDGNPDRFRDFLIPPYPAASGAIAAAADASSAGDDRARG